MESTQFRFPHLWQLIVAIQSQPLPCVQTFTILSSVSRLPTHKKAHHTSATEVSQSNLSISTQYIQAKVRHNSTKPMLMPSKPIKIVQKLSIHHCETYCCNKLETLPVSQQTCWPGQCSPHYLPIGTRRIINLPAHSVILGSQCHFQFSIFRHTTSFSIRVNHTGWTHHLLDIINQFAHSHQCYDQLGAFALDY